jgi:hypothetical protein
MTLKSSAQRTNERASKQARTITFVDKEGGEREHDFCCPHNYIKKKKNKKKNTTPSVILRYAWYYY